MRVSDRAQPIPSLVNSPPKPPAHTIPFALAHAGHAAVHSSPQIHLTPGWKPRAPGADLDVTKWVNDMAGQADAVAKAQQR